MSADFDQPAVGIEALADGIIDVPGEARTLAAAAAACRSGDTVRLAAGTFDGNVTIARGNVRIVGAGAGRTIVRGHGTQPTFEISVPASAEVAIADLTIGGQNNQVRPGGPGLLAFAGRVQLRNVIVSGNQASGIVLGPSAHLTMADCAVVGNRSATSGGGLRNDGGKALIVNCAFTGNSALTFGGAIYSSGGMLDVVACSFDGNEATSGAFGGAVFGERTKLQVIGSDFVRNESREAGGALYVREGSADIQRCRFTGNLAEGSWAVYSSGGAVNMRRSHLCGDAGQLLGGDLTQAGGNSFDAVCFPDCNQNGVSDYDEIVRGWAKDADKNGVPDDCDADCNTNGIPDAYEIASGWAQDANQNGMIDTCEIRMGLVHDHDHDLIPDDVQNDPHRKGLPPVTAPEPAEEADHADDSHEGAPVRESSRVGARTGTRSAPSEPRRFINRVLR